MYKEHLILIAMLIVGTFLEVYLKVMIGKIAVVAFVLTH